MTEIFYYGCEFLYTAVIAWGTFGIIERLCGGAVRVKWDRIARLVTVVFVAVFKVYNTSLKTGLFSNLIQLFLVIVISLSAKIVYKSKAGDNLLAGSVFWSLVAVGDFFVQTVAYAVFFENRQTDYLLEISIGRGIYLLVWTGILVAVIKYWIPKAKRLLMVMFKYRVVMWIFNAGLLYCLVYFQRIYIYRVSGEYFQHWWVFILGLILLCVVVLGYLAREKENADKQLLKMKCEMLENQYQQLLKERNEKDILVHDMKNHLVTISGLAKSGKHEEIMTYIQEMCHIFICKENHAVTNHLLLDLILDSKIAQAKEKGIQVQIESDDLSELCLSDMDICALFSNLLDNAIEANERIAGNGGGWITVLCRHHGCLLTIKMINPTGKIDLDDNLPKTSKTDKRTHGFGMQSIQQVVETHDGYMKYQVENGEFHIMICLSAFQ